MEFVWQTPLLLADPEDLLRNGTEHIENYPGVYYFSRVFRGSTHPFYIGKSITIRNRLKQHLRSSYDIVAAINGEHPDVGGGARYFHFSYYRGSNTDKAYTAIDVVEREMIRMARDNNVILLNIQYMKDPNMHEVVFSGHRQGVGPFPKVFAIERQRRE